MLLQRIHDVRPDIWTNMGPAVCSISGRLFILADELESGPIDAPNFSPAGSAVGVVVETRKGRQMPYFPIVVRGGGGDMYARTEKNRISLDIVAAVCKARARNFRAARVRASFAGYLA